MRGTHSEWPLPAGEAGVGQIASTRDRLAGMKILKIAIAGKGGSGKTSISGTMSRLLARGGQNVLAIDGDSNPNLA